MKVNTHSHHDGNQVITPEITDTCTEKEHQNGRKIHMMDNGMKEKADTDISYGRSHRLTQDTRIAVLTAGYGDGIPLELSNKGTVLVHGQHCPILGRVTMDQTIIDVSDLTTPPKSGDRVSVIRL